MANPSRGLDRASLFWLLLGGAVLLAWLMILGALGMLSALGWIVHPLAGILLAVYASTVFVPKVWRRPWPVLASVAAMLALSFAGAGWVVHPLAGITIGVFSSFAFTGRRRDLPPTVFAFALLALLSLLGAAWAVYPLVVLSVIALCVTPFAVADRAKRQAKRELEKEKAAPALPGETAEPVSPVYVAITTPEREKVEARPKRRQKEKQKEKEVKQDAPTHEPRLPKAARERLDELGAAVREGLAYLEEHGQQNAESYRLLRAIQDDHAPTAVRAFLRLPASLAATHPLQDGKTGAELLLEQLDLLFVAVRDIMTDVAKTGGQELLAHRRFLEDKFGKKGGDFEL